MIGGSYLAFEATEKILEKLLHDHHQEDEVAAAVDDPKELERMQVSGAIRTDFILSAEIMAIALASLENLTLLTTAIALAAVALAITAGVYGVVALIVKLDDIGLHMAERRARTTRAFGNALVRIVPKMLTALSGIGTAAMLWVGGGILVHGLEELHILVAIPELIHHVAAAVGGATGPLEGTVEWLVGAVGSAIVGLIVGGAIVLVIRLLTKHPEKLITD
jgi:predicted DNA repair protein MutK